MDLVEQMAVAIGKESAALGVNMLFAPLGDLARELRYGRVEESFSEDVSFPKTLFGVVIVANILC
jgi:beta-glucosidase